MAKPTMKGGIIKKISILDVVYVLAIAGTVFLTLGAIRLLLAALLFPIGVGVFTTIRLAETTPLFRETFQLTHNPFLIWLWPTLCCMISGHLTRQYQTGVRYAAAKFFFLFNLAFIVLFLLIVGFGVVCFACRNWYKLFLIF